MIRQMVEATDFSKHEHASGFCAFGIPSDSEQSCRSRACLVLTLFLVSVTLPRCVAEADEPVRSHLTLLSSSQRARTILAQPITFLWNGRPLRSGLLDLQSTTGVTIWLDRRIDPSQEITYEPSRASQGASLLERLQQVAQIAGAEVSVIENVVLLAPAGSGYAIERAAAVLHDRLSNQNGPATAPQLLQWQELCTPTDLMDRIAEQWDVQIEDDLPHDLLPAGKLAAPSTLATLVSILSGGFGKQAEVVGPGQLSLKPLENDSRWVAIYKCNELELDRLPSLRHLDSSTRIKRQGEYCAVYGVGAIHRGLLKTEAVSKSARSTDSDDHLRWTFHVRNASAEAVIEKLGASLGFEIMWDPTCTSKERQQLISFKVEQADLRELLERFGEAASLDVKLSDQLVRLSPAK